MAYLSERPAGATLISVVVPVFNNQQFIAATLASIGRQTHADFEAIVVDDGSTDDSAKVVASFCAADSRFRLLRQENLGASAARNAGAYAASGDWIAFCDGDDLWREDKLERQLEFSARHEYRYREPLVAIGSSAYFINSKGRVLRRFAGTNLRDVDEYYEARRRQQVVYVTTSSLMVRREAFRRIGGFRTELPVAQDVEFTTRVAEEGVVLVTPEPLMYYRLSGSSVSDVKEKFVRQRFTIRFIRENVRRRAAGVPEVDFRTFLYELKSDELLYRSLQREFEALFWYRRATVCFGNRKPLAAIGMLANAIIGAPQPVIRKVLGKLPGRIGSRNGPVRRRRTFLR